ncbi:MAG TPA: hypothetical protein VFU35_10555 [Jatrophihabitans sp.]|nr:hypothetical protein [Jatrophihabitans sp.]
MTLAMLLALAALFAAAAVLRVTSHESAAPTVAASSPGVPRPGFGTGVGIPAEQLGELVVLHRNPSACPPTIECTTARSVPSAFLAAVIDRLPAAVVSRIVAVTQTNPPRVYFRRLDATADSLQISVRVTRSDILDGLGPVSESRTRAGTTSRFVRFVTPANYEVVVEMSGPSNRTPPLTLLHALAADPRLLTLT